MGVLYKRKPCKITKTLVKWLQTMFAGFATPQYSFKILHSTHSLSTNNREREQR